jgi:hypothetical protein
MGYDERRLMTWWERNRVELTSSDLLVALAILSLLSAFLYPTLRSRAFINHVDRTANEVETLRSAALGVLSQTGAWPTAGEPGGIPIEVSGAFPSDSLLAGDEYTLQWTRWEVVDQVEAPSSITQLPADADAPPDTVGPIFVPVVRTVGGIVVHSGEDELLAELLTRYGRTVSFVRDTTWTLVVTDGD